MDIKDETAFQAAENEMRAFIAILSDAPEENPERAEISAADLRSDEPQASLSAGQLAKSTAAQNDGFFYLHSDSRKKGENV